MEVDWVYRTCEALPYMLIASIVVLDVSTLDCLDGLAMKVGDGYLTRAKCCRCYQSLSVSCLADDERRFAQVLNRRKIVND